MMDWSEFEENIKTEIRNFGGSYVWTDVILQGDYHIQKNVNTGKYRLLNGERQRLLLADYESCKRKLDEINPSFESSHLVLLIHGLGRHAGIMDKPKLKPFLSKDILKNNNPNIDAPFGYGEVLGTGRIDTRKLVSKYADFLLQNELLIQENFIFSELKPLEDSMSYKGIKARKIVFTTGFGLKNNPYFNYLPLHGTKAQLLTIKAPDLKEEKVIKSSVFIIPLGDDYYRIGATYEQKDKTNAITVEAKNELLKKLDSFLQCDYEVVDHVAGIRPSTRDRRPLVGRHPEYENMYVLNGFGSRGVMIAPYASKQLYNFIENNTELDPEMDVARFTKKFF